MQESHSEVEQPSSYPGERCRSVHRIGAAILIVISVAASCFFLYLSWSRYYNAIQTQGIRPSAAATLRQMTPDLIMALLIPGLCISLLRLHIRHQALKQTTRQLAFDEKLYHRSFDQASIGIIMQDCHRDSFCHTFRSVNPMAQRILGRDFSPQDTTQWMDLTHPEDAEAEMSLFHEFAARKIGGYSIEKRIIRPDDSHIWVNARISSYIDSGPSIFTYLCVIEDISSRKAMEETLRESERSKTVLLSHLPGMAYRCAFDPQWTMHFVSDGCLALTGYPPEGLISNRDTSYNAIISAEYQRPLWEKCVKALEHGKSFRYEYEIMTKTGERKWVLELGQGVYGPERRVEALEGIVLDISEQKKREAQITYLNEHDFLTGLYNRNYLEIEKRRLHQPEYFPLSVVVCDINGLRMINDAYGEAQGDRLIIEAAKLIQSRCLADHVLGRVSGGEFMLFMPNTSSDEVHEMVKTIQITIETYNRTRRHSLYEISLTVGYSTIASTCQHIDDAIKTAESYLKQRKLLNQKSLHHSIVSSIMATLYAKSQETEEHGQRLGQYATMIGEHLGLDQKALDDLRLLSMIHDIGKIGVDDSILNKPDKLTPDEWEQMRKHPEIGHRIAMATPELMHIAEHILHHHERWDGTGYPAGLKSTKIPLLSRILAIADAYDAMTEDRVYRQALTAEAAIAEIDRGAGTQFDPAIAALFIREREKEMRRSREAGTAGEEH